VARQVDQVWLPERVSGHPALELNNTFGGWGLDQPREYLVDYRVLVVLSRDVELLDGDESTALLEIAAQRPAEAERTLRDVKQLRAAMHAVIVDGSAAAAEQLRGFVSTAVRASRYRRAPDGSLRLDGGSGLSVPLHRFALALHSVLEQYPSRAIRPCTDDQCGFVFLDPSGRRRWCEMSVCGNRAKARRYAQRHRTR
jgi:predicted RNA-binding Zn ribbon-like protein